MKINLAVLFGGRSVEHEVSVISAVQAMASINKEKYNIIPVYMTKKSEFWTGEKLMDINSFRKKRGQGTAYPPENEEIRLKCHFRYRRCIPYRSRNKR